MCTVAPPPMLLLRPVRRGALRSISVEGKVHRSLAAPPRSSSLHWGTAKQIALCASKMGGIHGLPSEGVTDVCWMGGLGTRARDARSSSEEKGMGKGRDS